MGAWEKIGFLGCVTCLACLTVVGCVPSQEARSAGQVGCPPEEIEISASESHFGLLQSGESWVAECRGRRFVCSQLNVTPGRDEGLFTGLVAFEQVSCREELESPQQESVRLARQATLNAHASDVRPPPTGAAGFELGERADDAERRCEAASKEWSRVGDESKCSGAVTEVGFPVSVGLGVCGGNVCSITPWPDA